MDDEALLARAEGALTEIKIAHGLSEEHASVLAALRIRLKGDPGSSLEDLLTSAGDLGGPGERHVLDEALAEPEGRGSLDEALAQPERPKPEWPG